MTGSPTDFDKRIRKTGPLSAVIEPIFLDARVRGVFSGAALLLADPEGIVYENVFGHTRQGGPALSRDSRFDLASLTKPLAATLVCMNAVSEKTLSLDAPLTHFFPRSIVPPEKAEITLSQLLSHSSGLCPYLPFFQQLILLPPDERKQHLLGAILQSPPARKPGTEARYSDLGFLLLGRILEEALGAPMDHLFYRVVQSLVGQTDTLPRYVPLEMGRDPTKAPLTGDIDTPDYVATEFCPWRNRLLQGEVHDENAHVLGGIAPHAGLFGTARGVYEILSRLWAIHRGETTSPVVGADTLRLFWNKSGRVPHSTWTLGFDTPSREGSSAGRYFSPKSIGHLGFTGTSFWLDLEKERLVILLTNRVHPHRENDGLKAFRPYLHNTVTENWP